MLLTAQEMYDIICYGCDGLTTREDFMVVEMVREGWTVSQVISEVQEDRDELFESLWEAAA